MADRVIPKDTAAELQRNLVWSHKAGTGERLPVADVRAAMLLRANALTVGISGVRLEIIRRLCASLTRHRNVRGVLRAQKVYLCTSDQLAETGGERPHKMKSPQTPFRTT